jgi:hypothetical protein
MDALSYSEIPDFFLLLKLSGSEFFSHSPTESRRTEKKKWFQSWRFAAAEGKCVRRLHYSAFLLFGDSTTFLGWVSPILFGCWERYMSVWSYVLPLLFLSDIFIVIQSLQFSRTIIPDLGFVEIVDLGGFCGCKTTNTIFYIILSY